jgi:uncharacterized protein (TIGR02599 family)
MVKLKFQISKTKFQRKRKIWKVEPEDCPFRPRNADGFSLTELLVSMAILTTLMVLLFGFFEQATRSWQNSEKKADAFREARAALTYLKRDLEGLRVEGSLPFFYFDDPHDFSPIDYSGPTLETPAAHGDALFFMSSQSPEAQDRSKSKSDLCTVGYYLVYDKDASAPDSTPKSYRLLRYFKSSDEAWQTAAYGLFPFLQSVQYGSPNHTLIFPAANGNNSGDEVIARHVINFQARPLNSNYQPLTGSGALVEKPTFFDLSLTALNLESAQKLKDREDWHRSAPDYNNSLLFKQNAQEFRVRVAITR